MTYALEHREKPGLWFCSFGCGYSGNKGARRLYNSKEKALHEARQIAKGGLISGSIACFGYGYSIPQLREVRA